MSKQPRLTREQEHGRIEGLRVLARIIARHYLEHPDLYPAPAGDGVPGVAGGVKGVGEDYPDVDGPVGAAGDAARKEAAQ